MSNVFSTSITPSPTTDPTDPSQTIIDSTAPLLPFAPDPTELASLLPEPPQLSGLISLFTSLLPFGGPQSANSSTITSPTKPPTTSLGEPTASSTDTLPASLIATPTSGLLTPFQAQASGNSSPPSSTASSSDMLPSTITSPDTSATVIGLVAGSVLFFLVSILVFFILRRQRKHDEMRDSLPCSEITGQEGRDYSGADQSEKALETNVHSRHHDFLSANSTYSYQPSIPERVWITTQRRSTLNSPFPKTKDSDNVVDPISNPASTHPYRNTKGTLSSSVYDSNVSLVPSVPNLNADIYEPSTNHTQESVAQNTASYPDERELEIPPKNPARFTRT